MWFHNTAANWDSFRVAFWSGLLYSAIVATVVGAVVGYAIYRIQRRNEGRRFKQRCEGEVAMFRERLRHALNQPSPLSLDSVIGTLERPGAAVSQVMDNQPIPVWRDALPEHKPFFEALLAFQGAYSAFVTAANRVEILVDEAVGQYIRIHDMLPAQRRKICYYWPLSARYCRGRLVGLDDGRLLYLLLFEPDDLNRLNLTYMPIRNVPVPDLGEPAEVIDAFLERRRAAVAATDALKAALT